MKTSIQITLDSRKRSPVGFQWRGMAYRVAAVQECWRLVGNWWDGEGERTFFRVLVDGGGIFEICYDHGRQAWSMERVED
jgi:hypothetical protein